MKLTPKAAKGVLSHGYHRTDWKGREGTIIRRRRYTDLFEVLWDGRTSFDCWPRDALQEARSDRDRKHDG